MGDLVQGLAGVMMTAVTVAIPLVVPALLKRWGVANDADLNAKMQAALQAGAGAAYNAILRTGDLRRPSQTDAVAAGVAYVAQHMPETMGKLGMTASALAPLVEARLGVLLAADPSVSVQRAPE